jgi:hypothetical protein
MKHRMLTEVSIFEDRKDITKCISTVDDYRLAKGLRKINLRRKGSDLILTRCEVAVPIQPALADRVGILCQLDDPIRHLTPILCIMGVKARRPLHTVGEPGGEPSRSLARWDIHTRTHQPSNTGSRGTVKYISWIIVDKEQVAV